MSGEQQSARQPQPEPAPQPQEQTTAPHTYEAAAARVEEIIRRLDSGEASLNETLELVKEGKGLIEFCARELEAVGAALQELRLEELVSRLESGAAAGAGSEAGAAVANPGVSAGESPGSGTAEGRDGTSA